MSKEERIQKIRELMHGFHALKKAMVCQGGEKEDITHTQWMVIFALLDPKGESVSHLAQRMGVTNSAMTQFVNALEEKGYVERKSDPNDKRSVRIVLSKNGREYVDMMKEKRIQSLERVFAILSDEEFETLLDLHRKINQSLS